MVGVSQAAFKKNTLKTYQSILSKLTAQFGERDLNSLTPEEVLSLLTDINQRANQLTERTRYSQLTSFFNFITQNLDPNFRSPCDTPMLKKLYRPPGPIRWTILEKQGFKKVFYGMEPTANYHKPLGEFLIHLERTVVLVSGVTVKKYRESLDGRLDKHDVKDSANIADLISQGKCLYYEYSLARLRGLLSLKKWLKRQEHGYRVRIRNHLIAQYYLEMDREYDRLGAEGLAIMRWCFPPSEMTTLDVDPFIERVTTGAIRMEKRHRLKAIWEKAGETIGCDSVP